MYPVISPLLPNNGVHSTVANFNYYLLTWQKGRQSPDKFAFVWRFRNSPDTNYFQFVYIGVKHINYRNQNAFSDMDTKMWESGTPSIRPKIESDRGGEKRNRAEKPVSSQRPRDIKIAYMSCAASNEREVCLRLLLASVT